MNPDVKKTLIEAVRKLIALAEECAEEIHDMSMGKGFIPWSLNGLDVDLDAAIDECERAILVAEIADDAPSHG